MQAEWNEWYSFAGRGVNMHINWNRNIKKRQEYKHNVVCSMLLKAESNHDRRSTDRNALRDFLAGDDGAVFAMSNMGNPWHWD